MALKTMQADAVRHFGVEDVFTGEDASTGKLAWVSGWRKLPHLPRDVEKLFDYPQQFAEEIFERIAQALLKRASGGADAPVRTGRLFIMSQDDAAASPTPDLPARYIKSSNEEQAQIRSDRQEGRSLVSYKTTSGWVAVSKSILTEVLGAGRDVKVVGLPSAAAGALKLMCPNLVVLPENV
jgi:hypothetical protein